MKNREQNIIEGCSGQSQIQVLFDNPLLHAQAYNFHTTPCTRIKNDGLY